MIKKGMKWLSNILIMILIFLIALSSYSMIKNAKSPGSLPSIMGYRLLTILTGSMRPYLDPGDMILSYSTDPKQINVGDVITYRLDSNTVITHRVTEKTTKEGRILFKAKGDANNTEDQKLISDKQVVGSMKLKIPFAGYIAQFVKSPLGFIFFIIIPIIILIGGGIKTALSSMSNAGKSKEDPDVVNKAKL